MLPPDRILPNHAIQIQAAARSQQTADQHLRYQGPTEGPQPEESESRDFQLRRFRDKVYQELEATPSHYTVEKCAVDVSENGFVAMHDNADYYQQILRQIRKEFGTSYAPRRVCVHIQVGRTLDEYHVHSWASAFASDYEIYAKHSFYKRSGGSAAAASGGGHTPSAFAIYRDHLQMQLEKLDKKPPQQGSLQPRHKSQSVYEEMGYEDSDPENHDFVG